MRYDAMCFYVIQMLNDMQELERHPIMRIVNEFEKKDCEARNQC